MDLMPRLVGAVPPGACRGGVVGVLLMAAHRRHHFSANECSIRFPFFDYDSMKCTIQVVARYRVNAEVVESDRPLSYCHWRQSQSFPTWPRVRFPAYASAVLVF